MTLFLSILAGAFAVQLLIWAALAQGVRNVLQHHPDPDAPVPDLALSVVVAARNEEACLSALLDALDAQTHRPFEVVIVDDRSTDGTAEAIAHHISRQRADAPPIRLETVTNADLDASGLPPKKHALTLGIAAAEHNRLVFTDADTVPPPTWLERVASHASADGSDDGAVLIGAGPLVDQPGAVALFSRYETVQTAIWAAASVGWGRPWQAVGRNLSYSRDLFDRLGGFEHGAASLSGDDDLLVQAVAKRGLAPVRYMLDAEAAVPSDPPTSWVDFWRQKRRHASAGSHYPAIVLAGLALFHVSALLLWIGPFVLFATLGSPLGFGLLAAKILMQRAVLSSVREPLSFDTRLSTWQIPLDAASALYHVAFAFLGLLPKPKRW